MSSEKYTKAFVEAIWEVECSLTKRSGPDITAHLEVDFKKPVPMEQEITIRSYLEELGERKAIVRMEMEVKGEVRAKAKMVAVAVKDTM